VQVADFKRGLVDSGELTLHINGKRNFLALRHGFRTVARGARNREAEVAS
jgi:hypothetical protein